MMKKKPDLTSEMLRRLARGELNPTEQARIEAELVRSPELRAELALWKALPEATRVHPRSAESWERIEETLWSQLRDGSAAQQRQTPFVLRPALLVALAVLIVAAAWMFGSPALEPARHSDPAQIATNPDGETRRGPQQLTVPARLAFDTGRFEASGKNAAFEIVTQSGTPRIHVYSQQRKRVQGRDWIATGPDSSVAFRLNERVLAVVGPESRIEFREYQDQVVPFIVAGQVAFDVAGPAGATPLVVMTQYARMTDIGTTFSVRADEEGRGALGVSVGRVRLERPDHDPVSVLAGQWVSWEGPLVRVQPADNLGAESPEPLLELLRDTNEPPRADDGDRENVAGLQAARPLQNETSPNPGRPAGGDGPEDVTVTVSAAIPQVTGFQQALDNLPSLHRTRVEQFYKTVEEQMAGGYSLRAIGNLENFITENPAPVAEKAYFLIGECHYNLQQRDQARAAFLAYIKRYPYGAWVEMAKFRFAELAER
jgi:ferric-dicitrate binding protein FerR (iron transport regulator)